ncbi:hypothetical protein KIN20_022721 [Parelaphostrongylus tenuis]|uniref:SGF29 C-terminal domain-containing protein n=1 Tax=Parelaphostrongylus tenuis TaxID=148309 RepID=A0AAD5QUZ9_PARTN|nr:hypothetical protein KIN20_022721 [Parelaphostrongylus tenuis]
MVRHKKNDEDYVEEKRSSTIGDIYRKLVHVRTRKDRVNETLETLQSYTEKGGIVCLKNKAKALNLYQALLKACESEGDYIRRLLSDIEKIRRSEYKTKMKTHLKRHALMQLINLQGTSLPLFVGGVDGFPPPFVGAIGVPDSTPLKSGDSVAAYVDENWILAEVVAVSPTGRYDVKDVDDEQKVRLTIARRRLIPLPKWRADPERDAHALFPVEAFVLALYPQTTCFYKGVVQRVPQLATDDYLVAFEDPSYNTGYSPSLPIPQRYVVSYKEIKGKNKG